MMFFKSMLTLQKRFCLIDSPIPFQLVCNPMGTYNLKDEDGEFIGDRTDIDGTDICSRPAGAWLFDTWKLLPEKYMKENPAFKMAICYDASLLPEGQDVKVSYSDVNLGEGVAGVNGQDVQDVKTHELLRSINGKVGTIDTNVSAIDSALSDLQSSFLELLSASHPLKEVFNAFSVGEILYTLSVNGFELFGSLYINILGNRYCLNGHFVISHDNSGGAYLIPIESNSSGFRYLYVDPEDPGELYGFFENLSNDGPVTALHFNGFRCLKTRL